MRFARGPYTTRDTKQSNKKAHQGRRKKKMNYVSGMCIVIASAMIVNAAEPASTNAPAATPETVKEESSFPLSFGVTMDLYSAYIWHGCVLNNEPVVQPDVAMSYKLGDYGTITADVWMNFDTTGNNGQTHFSGLNEIDYTIQYAVDVGDFSLGVGHVWYTFPSVSSASYYPSTKEVFVSAAYNNEIVVPFVKAYYDYSEAEGVYATIGLRREFTVTEGLVAGAELAFGGATDPYTQYYFGDDSKSWFTDGSATVYTKYNITDNLFVGVRLGWMSLLNNDLKDVYHEDNILWGGINLGASL
jgi:uncharacterized protein (DUF1684 family)